MTVDTLTARLGSLIIDGATSDGDGLVWSVTAIDGWYDSTQVRSGTQEIEPVGETITVARQNGRAINLKLDCKLDESVASDRLGGLAFSAVETIKAAARCVEIPTLLTVTDPVRATKALVRRVGPVHTAFLGRLVVVQAQVPLLAEDPRRYATAPETDNISITGTNTFEDDTIAVGGTVQTPFTVTMRGPAVNPMFVSHQWGTPSTRPFVQWIGTLAASINHVIVDMRTGLITKDGSAAQFGPGSQLFDLVAGNNLLSYRRTSGTGTATATVDRSAAYD